MWSAAYKGMVLCDCVVPSVRPVGQKLVLPGALLLLLLDLLNEVPMTTGNLRQIATPFPTPNSKLWLGSQLGLGGGVFQEVLGWERD